jgi:hypothetical protein
MVELEWDETLYYVYLCSNMLELELDETLYNVYLCSNMLELEWDEELASVSQRHADQCQERPHCHLAAKQLTLLKTALKLK